MAIVFDTQAELEAFCEAFELRNSPQKQAIVRRLSLENESMVEQSHTAPAIQTHSPQQELALVASPPEANPSPMTDLAEDTSFALASVS